MGQPVVHFEIIGADPVKLREYYAALFGWTFNDDAPVAPLISEKGLYSFIDTMRTPDGVGIPGGVGGGSGHHLGLYSMSGFRMSRPRFRTRSGLAESASWDLLPTLTGRLWSASSRTLKVI